MGYSLYIVEKASVYRVCYSPVVEYDSSYWEDRGLTIVVLAKGLSIGHAYTLKRELDRRLEAVSTKVAEIFFGRQSPSTRGAEICRKLIKQLGIKLEGSGFSNSGASVGTSQVPRPQELAAVYNMLGGRVLLRSEAIRAVGEGGYQLYSNFDIIVQHLYLEEQVAILPGVGYERPGKLKCFRCGSESKIVEVNCGRCNSKCYYCEECILLGISRFCEPILIGGSIGEGDVTKPAECVPKLSFGSMTPAQQSASDELRNFVGDTRAAVALVWAVCGAGKTEVVFGAIATALSLGARVLYAAPRRDVVAELYPRFKEAFPEVSVTALYGGSDSKYEEASITLATTHQAVRFNHRFGLVVLDEVDAYPYKGSPFLPQILKRVHGQRAKTIYMTATPDSGILEEVRKRKGMIVTVPARHHGHGLPVPEILTCEPIKKGELDGRIQAWLYEQGLKNKAPVFVFVPTIALGYEIEMLLQDLFGSGAAQFVNARDSERDRKREDFRKGAFPFLVTTTIMERGITVSGAQVLVLWADQERVFDKETLIQIAGRAGRTTQCPKGKVLFVAAGITIAMDGAIKDICCFNLLAEKRGLLR